MALILATIGAFWLALSFPTQFIIGFIVFFVIWNGLWLIGGAKDRPDSSTPAPEPEIVNPN